MVVLSFDNPAALDVDLSGGKGASLARLVNLGFNVPPGIIVTAQAYRDFIAQADWLPAALVGLSLVDPEQLANDAAALQMRLKTLPFPPALAAALQRSVSRLVDAHDIENHFSVRSSATAEDGASAAFAGQHDTFLNTPQTDLAEKVKACWLSLWSDRAIAYRQQVGVGLLDADMAVVVQQMVEAEIAGVMFTVDAVAGDLSCVVVDANYGLGESVVSGETADHWHVDKASRKVTRRHLAEKEIKIVSAADGGTVEVALHGTERTAPCLDDHALAELTALGVAIQEAYGFPQDIEFARANGQFYILQSRPVTSIPARWTRDESAERFPNPVSPLAWELVEAGFHASLNHSFELMGLPPFEGKWFAMFEGYVYGNQNAVELYANGMPLALTSLDELGQALPVIAEKYGWVQTLPTRWAADLDWYLLKLGEYKGTDLSRLTLRELWLHVQDISATGARYFLPNIAISITQRVLYKVLHRMLGIMTSPEQAQSLFDALLAHCDTKTGAINTELHELARTLQDHATYFDTTDNAILLGDGTDSLSAVLPDFAMRLDRFLETHGHREVEFDPYIATWRESPSVVLDTLRVMSASDLQQPHTDTRTLKKRAQETLFALQQPLPGDFRYFFTEVVRLAQTYTSLDDLEHYQTTRLTLPMRRALRELGSRLVDLGVIVDPMDIFFANRTTLEPAILDAQEDGWTALSQNVSMNKALYLAARQRTPRWTLNTADEDAPTEEHGIKGLPGSPGKASGPVFVVRGPEDFGKFPKGAVLIARTTNPAWTPLFYGACAIVTESGGPLSHGAVTAREMQKPAVMAVRGVLTAFANGDWVEVDGARGVVTRLS